MCLHVLYVLHALYVLYVLYILYVLYVLYIYIYCDIFLCTVIYLVIIFVETFMILVRYVYEPTEDLLKKVYIYAKANPVPYQGFSGTLP